MRSVLLILAILITAMFFIPLLVRRTWHLRNGGLGSYHFSVAKNLDCLWCLLIWGIEDHTVSAVVFAKGKRWAIDIIDLLFMDDSHCYKAWKNEFSR